MARGKRVEIPQDRWQKIVEEYRSSTIGVTELARKNGLGYGTLFNRLRAEFTAEEWDCLVKWKREESTRNRKVWQRPSAIPPDVQQQMIQLYQSGFSSIEIGHKFGYSDATVRQRLEAHGVERRHKGDHLKGPKNPTRGKKRPPEMVAKLVELSRQRRGPKNHKWKGGITPLVTKVRQRLSWWTQAVFKRDQYTCQDCGQQHGDIEAHHLVEFSDLFSQIYPTIPLDLPLDEQADLIAQHPLMVDLDNGVTICHDCHEERHGRKHGRRIKKESVLS